MEEQHPQTTARQCLPKSPSNTPLKPRHFEELPKRAQIYQTPWTRYHRQKISELVNDLHTHHFVCTYNTNPPRIPASQGGYLRLKSSLSNCPHKERHFTRNQGLPNTLPWETCEMLRGQCLIIQLNLKDPTFSKSPS